MFEEHGFDELEDDGLFFGGEVLGGFEGEFEVVGGFAFAGFEGEMVESPMARLRSTSRVGVAVPAP